MRGTLALLASMAVLLAGCAGSGSGSPAAEDSDEPGSSHGPTGSSATRGEGSDPGGGGTVIVDGEEGSYACSPPGTEVKVDPNRTYEGPAHTHDYWGGQSQITIFDDDVSGSWFDIKGGVVLTGTGAVDFKVTWTEDVSAIPETRLLEWSMPGDGKVEKYYSHRFETKNSNHTVAVNLSNNDPPHYKRTTWSFKIDAPSHVTITIHRGYDCLPIDPPHYDYWGDATEKLLSTTVVKVAEDSLALCAQPADLCTGLRQPGSGTFGMQGKNTSVPPGTQRVEVVVSWKNDHTAYPTKIRIEYQTAATDGGATSASAYWKRPSAPRTISATSQAFEVTPGPDDWDSPYATSSLWRFKWFFDGSSGNAALGDSGLFKGEITFVFTAYKN